MNKTIFILGCGIMQIPALRIGAELGWHVVAADGNADSPGSSLCSEFLPIDLSDTEALIEAAKKINGSRGPDGVFTAGTDFSLPVAIIGETLGLPGHSVDAARRATDKVLMRNSFKKAGVPSPDFLEVRSMDDVSRVVSEIPGPWVVKPVDSMGARGVIRVDTHEALAQAIKTAQSYSRSGRALAETFMEGPEFSLDALVENGRLHRCGLADRLIVYPPCFIEIGHSIPSSAAAHTADALWAVFEKGIKALGLNHGAAKGDVKMTPSGPMIGEIAGRLSGGYMSGWTWPAASAVRPTLEAMRLAVGLPCGDLSPQSHVYCAERALIGIDGRIHRIEGVEQARAMPGVVEVFLCRNDGDTISFPRNNVEKLGNVIATGASSRQAEERAHAGLRRLRVHLEPSDTASGTYLDAERDFPPDAFDTEGYFDALWLAHPPKPSRGATQIKPIVPVPVNLPECRDSTGRTMRDILDLLSEENRLELIPGDIVMDEESSCFWKAISRGGLMGLSWYLDQAGA